MANLKSIKAICTGGTRQENSNLNQSYNNPYEKTIDLGADYVAKIVAQFNAGN